MNIRRILVAIDASAPSLAALEAAAAMAARWEAELVGLFVEDINLLRLAALPFAREWGYPSAMSRALDAEAMERSLRSTASRAERALAEAARRSGVPWTFRVARGSVAGELLSAAAEADLVALGKAGHALGRWLRLGSTAMDLATRARGGLLLLERGGCIASPVLVLYDGKEGAGEALAAGVSLARMCDGELLVLVTAATRGAALRREAEARGLVPAGGPTVRSEVLVRPGLARMTAAIRSLRPGALVLSAGTARGGARFLAEVCGAVPCPVFLARPAETQPD